MTTTATAIQSAFVRFFTEAAVRIDLRDDRLVVLNDMRRVLLIERGEVDLFAVQVRGGQPSGRWTPLCRVSAGTILFGSPPGPRHSIVGRAVPGAVLSYLPVDRLRALSAVQAASDDAAGRLTRGLSPMAYAVAVRQAVQGIDAGIVAIAGALRTELPPREFVPLAPRGITAVDEVTALRSIDGVLWVHVEHGVVLGEGVTGRLTGGADICLTERDWLVTEGPARLRTRPTTEVLA